jgi:hypothetical protein
MAIMTEPERAAALATAAHFARVTFEADRG